MVMDTVARAALDSRLSGQDLHIYATVTAICIGDPDCVRKYLATDVADESGDMRGASQCWQDSRTGESKQIRTSYVEVRLAAQQRLCSALASSLQSAGSWEELQANADEQHRLCGHDAARKLYTRAMEKAPAEAIPVLLYSRAQCSLNLKALGECKADCTAALRCAPSNLRVKLLHCRASGAIKAGDVAGAVSDLAQMRILADSPTQACLEDELYSAVFGPRSCQRGRIYVSEQCDCGAGLGPKCRYYGASTHAVGKVHVFGGLLVNGKSLEEACLRAYDVASGEWAVQDTDQESKPLPRYGHILESLEDAVLMLI
ncbi:unnamed protein product [Polarella glacialis]|uniref:Uncharacterized protein n=1 Tax=Polarella glacialis TaxID=89957 RepID=A0A813FT39_POLGL|nr:unnamed protein product [Polarella glacialis]